MKKKWLNIATMFICTVFVGILIFSCTTSKNDGSLVASFDNENKETVERLEEIIHEEYAPDFSLMTSQEWYTYEWHMDESTILADITSYDVDYIRNILMPLHQQGYVECVLGAGELPEKERLELVKDLHNARMLTPLLNNPEEKRYYLWLEGKMPYITEYSENPGYFFGDTIGFRPFMIECLLDESISPKGAVLICAGGGFNCRCNLEEGIEVANALNALGYQAFIVNYRLKPYSVEEGALDVARAVKIVRSNATRYRIDENKIACAGFSAGGFVISTAANLYYGDINATKLVEDYIPDEIDTFSSDINAYLAIYTITPDDIINENFPPTFFAIGSEDGLLWDRVMSCFKNCLDTGIRVEIHTFTSAPHGFGAGMDASGVLYSNAASWPALADTFMQDVYMKQM